MYSILTAIFVMDFTSVIVVVCLTIRLTLVTYGLGLLTLSTAVLAQLPESK